jgi:hypothetical protein
MPGQDFDLTASITKVVVFVVVLAIFYVVLKSKKDEDK